MVDGRSAVGGRWMLACFVVSMLYAVLVCGGGTDGLSRQNDGLTLIRQRPDSG